MVVAPIVISSFPAGPGPRPRAQRSLLPDLVELRPGTFLYRVSGEFTSGGKPATAPILRVTIKTKLAVMRHQVTAADYQRCVEDGACSESEGDAAASDRPMVKVSWRDAHAYASWLSRTTGINFRLPTDEEWVYAAGDRFKDDALPEGSYGNDPVLRTLAIYEREALREETVDKTPKSIGSFGVNENGLLDVAGNVWEWTDTCFSRGILDAQGKIVTTTVDCGGRVLEGRHRAYMTDFIRDVTAGGCSAGTPPSNLGFRLIRADDASSLRLLLERALRFVGLGD